MLGKSGALGKRKTANSWQMICNQSNGKFINGACQAARGRDFTTKDTKVHEGKPPQVQMRIRVER
jgi:hypothetical protein